MDDYRAVLKQQYRAKLHWVGIVLIAIGLVDLGYRIYTFDPGQHLVSYLAVLTVTFGIDLLRRRLHAVSGVTWGLAFLTTVFVLSTVVLLPLSKSVDLWLTEFRLDPIAWGIFGIIRILMIASLIWVYVQLRMIATMADSLRTRYTSGVPKLAFALGIVCVMGWVGFMQITLGGSTGERAVMLARQQYGDNYQYHVMALQWSNGTVTASLTAYNDAEIISVQVDWDQ